MEIPCLNKVIVSYRIVSYMVKLGGGGIIHDMYIKGVLLKVSQHGTFLSLFIGQNNYNLQLTWLKTSVS